jgi:multidrug efflux pump subunit AcrA (membrane-fusion protein)
MKFSRTGLIATVIIVVAAAFIGFRLKSNRNEYLDEIAVARRKVDRIAVSIDTVNTGIILENVKATGTLESSEALMVVSETQGRIVSIFREKGDVVSKGDVIAKVDDEVISANVLTAEARSCPSP